MADQIDRCIRLIHIQQCIEIGINGNNPPLDSVPPAVTCQPADGSWHGDNVTLSCTATDGLSGLANAADASFTLMTSVVGGSADANAMTDSHTVCDTAGNCTSSSTSGTITFFKAFASAPSCIVVDSTSAATVPQLTYTVSVTAITISTMTSAHVINWVCVAKLGG